MIRFGVYVDGWSEQRPENDKLESKMADDRRS